MRSFLALVRKDFKGYFDQPTGYILIVLFVALLSWSFFFQSNEVTLGIASLRPLFSVDFVVEQPSIPWLLALFVPAATMRLIAEEQRDGTLEILLTQPIRGWVILLTKFASGLVFVAIAIIATLSIPLSIQFSGAGNLDWGAIVAQYVGSIFLAASFVAIGLFTSSLTRNQIVSFILGLFFVLILMLIGLDQVGVTLPPKLATLLQTLSPLTHFSSIARGVIDLRDVLYFVALVSTFLSATFLSIRGKTLSHRSPQYRNLQLGTVALIVMSLLIGWFGNSVAGRLDLTADKTFTLSPGTRDIVSSLDDLLTIELFQSKEPPVEVDLVARDVNDFLKDLASESGDNVKLIHRFPDVDEDDARKAQLAGIPPVQFNVQTANGLEIKNGYLGVALTYTNLRESIPFVQSIDGFEYRIATLAYGMVQADVERKTIGFLAGHGEKSLREDLASLVSLLAQQYEIREVTAVDDQAPDLSEIDVLIVAGPTQRMAEAVYGSIRDFLASGGKAMIMIDPVVVDQQVMFAVPNQFHFGEFVEDYGVVVEDNLVFDLRSHETLSFNTARGSIFLPYEYWARVPTVDKKVAGQVESVLLPWASSIGTTESRVGDVEFIPLLRTTPFGVADYTYGDVSPNNPSLTNPNSRPFENDIGVAVEGSANGEGTFRLIVIGDSDWLTDRIVGRAQENLALGLNLVDWLAQEDALADIRSKVITTRTLIFDSPAQRNIVQYANILGLPLLFMVLGLARYVRRRRINLKVYSSEE
ncbi:MAG: Gldg family protein [Chloroflexi bacterium]|nr:Gldg family protein [Chloroflexota bacterium]